ncbi:MAG: hypothetical protein A2Y93_15215 [Chloroflexi bacterium RBG_13_68_17]|nr:MAG: hypothetical protein A2Y93_15215 [Chloroflexi bacterium RBG_13_68_17]
MNLSAEQLRHFLASRRSVRRFRSPSVAPEVLRRILESAILAPSAHNRQPWRFVVVEEERTRRRLAEAMGGRFLEDLRRDGLAADEAERRVERSRERLLTAPALIVICLTMAEMDVYPDEQRRRAEHTMAVQSAALAAGHLLLAAHAEGLGSCWMCAPLFVPEILRAVLSLPEDWEPQGMIALGVPEIIPPDPGRRPPDEVTLWR